MERIICLVVGYAFGLIESGYLYGKMNGIDIRQHGSGNSGTTNALRVLGKKAGLVVFIGDVLKTMIPCVAVRILFRDDPPMGYLLTLYTGLGVILGHNYPFTEISGRKGNCGHGRDSHLPGLAAYGDLPDQLRAGGGGEPVCVPGLPGGGDDLSGLELCDGWVLRNS